MPSERRHPNIVNKDELEANGLDKGKHKGAMRRFGPAAGNQQLGATLMELPVGAISFPFHYHCMNEESIYVISGTGTARIGDKRVAIRGADDERGRVFADDPDPAAPCLNADAEVRARAIVDDRRAAFETDEPRHDVETEPHVRRAARCPREVERGPERDDRVKRVA